MPEPELSMLFDILVSLAFIAASVALVLGSYFTMRFVAGRAGTSDRELASSVLTRIAAVHALILALVFAQEMVDYQQLRSESATEANAVADIYNDARRYGADAEPIRIALRSYLDTVIGEEWQALATDRRLSSRAWGQWESAYAAVLDLVAAGPRQEALRDHMLAQLHTISEQRVKREMNGQDSLSRLFWFAAITGLIFTALAYYPYAPDRSALMLLSMFGAFVGVVLFLIYAFSNPYAPPGALGPGAFERLRASMDGG